MTPMNVLLNSLLLFGFAFVVHLVLWRIHVPKRQTASLLILFAVLLAAGGCLLMGDTLHLAKLGIPAIGTAADLLQIGSFYIACMLAYIVVYSALAADSPSLVLIQQIADAGAAGLSRESLREQASAAVLIDPRLQDLIKDRVADFDAGRYRLRPKGERLARLITFYRNTLMRRFEKGG